MNIIYLTKYSRLGASSRLRSYQFEDLFTDCNIEASYAPFFDDAYLNSLYFKKRVALPKLLFYYLRRFLLLFKLFQYDKVVVEKELFPYFPPVFERLIRFLGINYVVDYDDAIFHNYDLHPNKLVRFLLKNKIATVMRNSSLVMVGNDYLKQYALQSGAKNVITLPTVIDLDRYTKPSLKDEQSKVVIGWMGSPTTFKYFKSLENIIIKLNQKYTHLEWHVVGAQWDDMPSNLKSIYCYDWSEELEVAQLNQMDIGVMPLFETPWEKGKCAYKLIQYMGAGLPVIASPVGKNNEVVYEGVNGFLAETETDWLNYLEVLILNQKLRKELGTKGRGLVEQKYSKEINFRTLFEIVTLHKNVPIHCVKFQ